MDEYQDYNSEGFDWDDTIEADDSEYTLLPEGDYVFEVTKMERARFPGSAKLPPCNKATLTLKVTGDSGSTSIRTDIILARSLEWKISQFFRSIGFKKHGEKLVMNWGAVTGARGRVRVKQRTYVGKDGNERTTNDIDKFLDYDESLMPAVSAPKFKPVDDEDLPF